MSDAAWIPAYPPPARMYRSNAACWSAFRTSPVVDNQMTTSYFASSVSLNMDASSVAVTVKLFAAASSVMAWIPAGIESCRNPAVLLKMSALKVSSPCPG